MELLAHLWLPIVLSAVFVFFWNFLTWAALNLHGKDTDRVPNEDEFLNAMRGLRIPPGNYGFPYCSSHTQRNDPAFMEKWKTGPIGLLKVWPTKISMATPMIASIVLYLVVGFMLAYLGSVTLKPGDAFGRIIQVIGTAGVLAYGVGFWPNGIWFRSKPRMLVLCTMDAVVSGLGTAAIFALLWPKA